MKFCPIFLLFNGPDYLGGRHNVTEEFGEKDVFLFH